MIKLRPQGDGYIPDWIPPRKLPSLRGANFIAVDTETMDHSIQAGLGAGGAKGMGRILGVSVATDTGYSGYFDTRIFPLEAIREWAGRELCRNTQTKVYANGLYDLEWFRYHGIPFDIVNVLDVQIMEPLIDAEKRIFNLDSLGKKYLPPEYQKCKGHLASLVSEYLGKKVTEKTLWQYLDQVPPECIGGYAEMDAIVTLKVALEQLPIIKKEELEDVARLELRQWPLLLEMRFKGVRINKKVLNENHDFLYNRARESSARLDKAAGFEVDVNKNADLLTFFEKVGAPITKTEKGNPSFAEPVLKEMKHPVADLVMSVRKDQTAMNFTSAIMEHMVKGRIHGQFNALKSDTTGTVSGRYSSSNPNLQNQPGKKNPEMGALLRSCYIPETGCLWGSADYNQIEFRLIVDYAARTNLKKAKDALKAYQEDPNTDFHAFVMRLTGLERPHAKTINFGLAYRMGKGKLIDDLGVSVKEGERIFEVYHDEVPFVNELMRRVTQKAEKIGYIKTLSGRRARFDLWEDASYGNFGSTPLPKDEAIKAYERVKRAYCFKAGNRLIQGSAADIMKEGMASSYEAGVYNVLTPHITVHDEMNVSVPKSKEGYEAYREMVHVMTSVYSDILKVPVRMEMGIGPNWWKQKEFK